MVWVADNNLTTFQKCCANILKCGPIPNHIAIIMDGNRRCAKKSKIQQKDSYLKGFDKLTECALWCRELGVKETTVYAFSIENFKRSQSEVDALLKLFKEKFMTIFDEIDQLNENGMCIRVIGNLSFLPENLKNTMIEACALTKNNDKFILNVACSYVSREEITHSIRTIVKGVEEGVIKYSDISEELISKHLYTRLSTNPDMLIRTSGEVRLSDFLLWQLSKAQISYTDVLWPEFTFWDFFGLIFNYQRSNGYDKV